MGSNSKIVPPPCMRGQSFNPCFNGSWVQIIRLPTKIGLTPWFQSLF
ncbi:hypothetical protein MCHI_003512 [Candidatus Magnetoovum chiemensis]|nr:hypothetical protein MCHI_003512 [Candidatus Magnetoovum chiemensis]